MKHHAGTQEHAGDKSPYLRLAIMAVASFVAMYVLMYAMVDRVANAVPNLNQAYMAGLMTAPMVAIELLVMWSMYPNRRLNQVVLAASVALLAICWTVIRAQTAITDRQFLRSMIPHHAGAILMCEQTDLRDVVVGRSHPGRVRRQRHRTPERVTGRAVAREQRRINVITDRGVTALAHRKTAVLHHDPVPAP
jgi:hypothetical protein